MVYLLSNPLRYLFQVYITNKDCFYKERISIFQKSDPLVQIWYYHHEISQKWQILFSRQFQVILLIAISYYLLSRTVIIIVFLEISCFLRFNIQKIPLKNIISKLKMINPQSKFVPNFIYSQSEEPEYISSVLTSNPFRQIDNLPIKQAKKSNKKPRTPKTFLEVDLTDDQNSITEQERKENFDQPQETTQMNQRQEILEEQFNKQSQVCSNRLNMLLALQINEDSDYQTAQKDNQNNQSITNLNNLPPFKNLSKIDLGDWDKTESGQSKQQAQQNKTCSALDVFEATQDNLYRKIENNKFIDCLLRRDKNSTSGYIQYNIYLKGQLKHIVTVRKQGMWKYCIYMRKQQSKGQCFKYELIGQLQSSFLGNGYRLIKKKEKKSYITVSYKTNPLGLFGPRKFYVYLPKIPLKLEYLQEQYENGKNKDNIQKYVSKTAKWSDKVGSYVLNFHGKAKQSSIKNFIITDLEERQQSNFIIFGKVGPEVYNLQIKSPYSIMQGIAVALTSFERKITCD